MSIIKNYRLRLDAGNITPLIIHVNQYDKNEIWNFTLIDYQGNQYITTEAAIVGKKPDGCLIANNCTVSEGIVSVEVTEQMTAAAGKAVFELLVDGQMHGTANFFVMIERSPEDGAIESESDLSLFQQAIDATSTPAIIAGVQAWMDENLTPTTPVVDSSLSISGAAADAKKTGDEINDLKSAIASSQGMSAEFKAALENLVDHVAFIGDDPTGQTYIEALHTAMYPPANLSSITAVYTQSGTVLKTASLESLKSDLVVTARYDNGTSEVLADSVYVLSGTLTVGTSTITVSYGGKIATFDVIVSEIPIPAGYTRVPWVGSLNTTTSGPVVDTGVTLSGIGDMKVELGFMSTQTINSNSYFVTSVRNDSQEAIGFGVGINSSSTGVIAFNGILSTATPTGSDIANTYYEATAVFNSTSSKVTVGSESDEQSGIGRTYSRYPIHLFGLKNPSVANKLVYPISGRIYYLTITEDDTEVMNLIPVTRDSDSAVGFYDLINATFITADGLTAGE